MLITIELLLAARKIVSQIAVPDNIRPIRDVEFMRRDNELFRSIICRQANIFDASNTDIGLVLRVRAIVIRLDSRLRNDRRRFAQSPKRAVLEWGFLRRGCRHERRRYCWFT